MATPPTPILSRTSRGGVLSQTARTNSDASGASVKTVQQSPLTLPNAAAAAAASSGLRPLARKVRLSLAPSSRRGSAQGSSTTTATGGSGSSGSSSSSGGGAVQQTPLSLPDALSNPSPSVWYSTPRMSPKVRVIEGPRTGKQLWECLRKKGTGEIKRKAHLAQLRVEHTAHEAWGRLRDLGPTRIIELDKLSRMWTEEKAVKSEASPASVSKKPPSRLSKRQKVKKQLRRLLTVREQVDKMTAGILAIPVFYWKTGEDRELGRGVRNKLRGYARRIDAMLDYLHDDVNKKPLLVRWGKRKKAEPMIVSAAANLIPTALLLLRGRSFLAALLFCSLLLTALHHIRGETRPWLHLVHLCPLVSTIPLIAYGFYFSASLVSQLVTVFLLIYCTWLYRATGHPGTYSYEKYHLWWHWVWFVICLLSVLFLPRP
ncbi:hypothetical protein DIPPA_05256 [Diplonema papillatum]|nr:hypothetical protein DIPPA_05256 [Diplonema papillatum]